MKSRRERKSLKEIIKIRNYYVFEAGQRETDEFLQSIQNCSEDLRPWVDSMTDFITCYRPKAARKRQTFRFIKQQRGLYLKNCKKRIR